MASNQFYLLRDRRFLPLFITQFLGAFHDNLFKNALVVMLIYKAAADATYDPKLLTTLAMGVFILPFVLFSAIGGSLADKYPKDKVMRTIKIIEMGIAALGCVSLVSGSIPLSFFTLFALGTHSAFFGPSKYSIMPQHLEKQELISANALLNTGTFLAILTGTIAGTTLITLNDGAWIVGAALFVVSGIGYISCRFVPPAPPVASAAERHKNPFIEGFNILRYSLTQSRTITLSILGVSWFYFIGGMFMAQFANYTHETLGADARVLTFFLMVFSVGIAVGGLLNNRLLRGRIEAVYVPLAMFFVSVFSLDLYFASTHIGASLDGSLLTLGGFVAQPASWRITFDIAMIAVCGGLFEVPLSAMIQHHTHPDHRARVQAGNAIMNALFMVASAIFSAVLLGRGWSVHGLFAAFAVANSFVALYILPPAA